MSPARITADDPDERVAAHPLATLALHGLSGAERALLDAYRGGRLHHAWLIGGPRGIGKATLAWHFARFLLSHPDATSATVVGASSVSHAPDQTITARLLAGGHSDLAFVSRRLNDKTKKLFTEIRVDDVRDALGLFQRASAAGGYRICIIDSAEDLNRSSANALLKAVEEPPPRSLFLIITHQPGQVMPTLVSRSRRLMVPALGDTAVHAALRALHDDGADAERLAQAAARAQGSVGEALRLLGGETLDLDAAANSLLARLPEVDWTRVHRLADLVGTADDRLATALQAIDRWLETQVHRRATEGPQIAVRFAEAWSSIRAATRETTALNLDKRPLLLAAFADLARAAR